jgi:beta-lactam-binding protein with PASTA domain
VARTDQLKATRVLAVVTAVLIVVVGASAFSGYRSSPPVTATQRSTEVPALLGLGSVGAESLLRNARLGARFELVHGPEGDSVGTVVKQSPDGGDTVATGSTVLVVINIGPSGDDPNLTYQGRTSRQPAEPPSVRTSDAFRPHIESENADSRGPQGETSAGPQPRAEGDSSGKSGKGKGHGKSG